MTTLPSCSTCGAPHNAEPVQCRACVQGKASVCPSCRLRDGLGPLCVACVRDAAMYYGPDSKEFKELTR